MDTSPSELSKYTSKKYPEGKYYSVYEAGFCRYGIHRGLEKLDIIVSPSNISTGMPLTGSDAGYLSDFLTGQIFQELNRP